MRTFKTVLTGMMMAMADSVPGVSGGTICYIMGFYDKLFTSLLNLKYFKSDRKLFLESLNFLVRLGCGWLGGFIIAILVINSIITSNIYLLSSMFIGFILISIPLTINKEIDVFKDNTRDVVFSFLGLILVVGISYLGTSSNFSVQQLPLIPSILYFFFTGFLAIGCMLLPGISGSTMLIIFGVYYQIIDAVHKFLHLDFSSIGILIVSGLGILCGGLFAIKFINHILTKYRSKVLYFIQGLMIGSLYAIILGPTTVQDQFGNSMNYAPLNFSNFSIIGVLFGCILIIGIQKISTLKDNS